jgi:hypothetical protein
VAAASYQPVWTSGCCSRAHHGDPGQGLVAGVNYDDEDYVRLYTRDTITWKMLGWQGQTVLLHMLKGKFDRSGVFVTGRHAPSRAVTAVLDLPHDVVESGLQKLLDEEVWVLGDGCIVWPNYVSAQNSRRSDRARQRDQRQRNAAIAASKRQCHTTSQDVTQRDGAITGESHDVTPSHASRAHAAASLAEPSLAKPNQADPTPQPPSRGASAVAREMGPEYDGPAERTQRLFRRPEDRDDVQAVWSDWKAAAGKPGARLDHSRAEVIAMRLDQGATREECQLAFRGAGSEPDGWLVSKGLPVKLILGDQERFEHLVDLGRGKAPRGPKNANAPPQQTGVDVWARVGLGEES